MGLDRGSDQFLLDAYTGLGGFRSGAYLVRHARESDDKFRERQVLAEYPNYVRKVIDVFSGFLYAKPPQRETADLYTDFADNADGAGGHLDVLILSHQRLAMLLGTVYLIVDRPQGKATSRADQPDPYLALRLPGALVRSQQDQNGQWRSVTFREAVDGEARYRQFNVDGWRLSTDVDSKEIIDQGEYTLGKVPVVRLHSTIPLLPGDERATPWSHDVTQANWSLYNRLSEMNELFRKQTFSILTLPVQDQDEAERLTNLRISTENALTFNPTGGGAPGYIAPPPDPINAYMNAIAANLTRIYQQANLEFVGGVASSGVERKYQFAQTNRSMVSLALLAEQAEQDIAALVAAWQGREWQGLIRYPRDFDLSDLGAELNEALESQSLGVSRTFDREIKRRVARRMLGYNVDQATMEEIDREIDADGDPYGDRVKQEAGNLPPIGA